MVPKKARSAQVTLRVLGLPPFGPARECFLSTHAPTIALSFSNLCTAPRA